MKQLISCIQEMRDRLQKQSEYFHGHSYQVNRLGQEIETLDEVLKILYRIESREIGRIIADYWFYPVHQGVELAYNKVIKFLKGEKI